MKSSVDILDAIAKKLGGASDYRIWKDTGIYHGTISSVRAGRCSLSRDNCAKAADILGVEVGALIAIVTAEREENPAIRASLLRVARKGMAAAAMAAAVGLSAAPSPPVSAAEPGQSVYYVKSRRRRPTREILPVVSIDCAPVLSPPGTRKPLLTLRTSPTLMIPALS